MTDTPEEKRYNLSEIARLTGIHRSTLYKYMKMAPERFAGERVGTSKLHPASAVKVFEELRDECRRGVDQKRRTGGANPSTLSGQAPKGQSRPKESQIQGTFHSLTDIARITGIDRQALYGILRAHKADIPRRKVGTRMEYPPEAIKLLQTLHDDGSGNKARPIQRVGPASRKFAPRRAVSRAVTSGAAPSHEARPRTSASPRAPLPPARLPSGEVATEALGMAFRCLNAPKDVQAAVRILLERAE